MNQTPAPDRFDSVWDARGRLSRFSLDALVNIAAKLGAYSLSH